MPHEHLLSPGRIGALELRNRVIMTPMGSNLAETDGQCGERIQAYYEARARGGAGMVIMGVGAIAWPVGACNPNQVAISDDRFLPGLSRLVERVQRHGCKAAIQLQHAGQVAVCDIAAGRDMLVPSVPRPKHGDMTQALTEAEMNAFVKNYTAEGAQVGYREATEDDLRQLIDTFADAADRAQRAGFDGVEIHAGHGYILSSFLSPHSNRRTDAYGGSIENRARLLVAVIQAVKARVGDAYPVWCRLDAHEFRIEDGITLPDAARAAELAVDAGADAIHVSAYADSSVGAAFTEAPLVHQEEGFVPFAVAIREAVSVPVIAVGRIEPERADRFIGEGAFDFVAMGRKLLADPDLPNKLATGEPIRPCIYCYTCVSQIFLNEAVRCAVNPVTGREHELEPTPTTDPCRVLVIGGGPAGMEAARVARLRGHEVTLWEQGKRLGGTAFFSSFVYPPNGGLVDYLAAEIRRLGVTVVLNRTADREAVAAWQPDTVVVATGARREAPPLIGLDRPHVYDGDELRQLLTGDNPAVARQKLGMGQRALVRSGRLLGMTRSAASVRRFSQLWMPVGQQIVILGGGLVGLELAEFLAERGRDITVLEERHHLGVELPVVRRWRVLHELRQAGVMLVTGAVAKAIETDHVVYTVEDETPQTASADTVIVAQGATGDRSLAESLSDLPVPVHAIGDCTGVGYIDGAIRDGFNAGMTL